MRCVLLSFQLALCNIGEKKDITLINNNKKILTTTTKRHLLTVPINFHDSLF
jgi:hypothetical protein